MDDHFIYGYFYLLLYFKHENFDMRILKRNVIQYQMGEQSWKKYSQSTNNFSKIVS